MSTTWNCDQCHLSNSSQTTYCQACFNHIIEEELDVDIEVISNENKLDDVINEQNMSIELSENEDLSMEYDAPQTNDESNTEIIETLTSTTETQTKFDSKSSVNPQVINKLMTKQHILFDGFFRCSNSHKMFIPSDIVKLSFAFFELNINKICTNYDDLYELAMVLRAQRDCFIAYEAMNCLILESNGELSEYHNAMGLILKRWNSNCFDEAEIYYKKAINSELTENIYKWNYGLLLEERQKFDLALQQFLCASHNVDEKEPDYIFEAAYCYQKLGDYNNATINYLKAIEMNGNKSSYWIYYAEYLCEELKQYKKSIKCFEKAIKLENESNINYYYRFARYLRDFHQNYKLSKIYYLKCLSMNKTKDENGKIMEIKGVNGSFGYLLFLMGEYDESNKYLSLAQISDPKNAWTFFYYGLLNLSYFKDKNKAYQLLNKAIQCCTAHFSIKKHLQRIKQVDPNNIQYHNKFESLLNQKFDC